MMNEEITTVAEELTAIEADELLEKIAKLEAQIKAAEDERNAFIAHYQAKIATANELCDRKCQQARIDIASLTEQLRRYAVAHLPEDGRRTLTFPSGRLSFRKQPPRYFFDDLKEAGARDERVVQFVRHNAHEYLKVKVDEYVDWIRFRAKLACTGDNVIYKETGEIIEGLHAQVLPDKFTVQTS